MSQRGFNTPVATRYGVMWCNRHDIYVSGSLIQYGEYSELEVQFVRSLVPVGGVIIQVGAHIGSLTVPMAQHVGPDGMLIAFEPQRLPFQLLCTNVATASLEHVQTVHAGVGARYATATVQTIDPTMSFNTGGIRLNAEPVGESVRVVALDGYVSPPRFDLLHADVEGMEEDVLRGAESLIRKHRPVLYVEAIDADKRPSLFAFMRSLGYRLWHHDPPMYNPDNYAGNTVNYLRNISSLNILGWPAEREQTFNLTDPHLRPVEGA
jgi:FkbM family methyltransferase